MLFNDSHKEEESARARSIEIGQHVPALNVFPGTGKHFVPA